MAPGRTSGVGQGQCQDKFFMVGWMGGRRRIRDVKTSFQGRPAKVSNCKRMYTKNNLKLVDSFCPTPVRDSFEAQSVLAVSLMSSLN